MNPLLENIYEQPLELNRVLDDLIGPKLEHLRDLSRIISLSEEVVLTSMGSAFYSLMPMYEAMLSLGMQNVRLVETTDLIQHPERLSGNALYVMMSRSGESREVADFSGMLSSQNLSSMCVSMTPDSTMARNCRYSLHDIASYDKIVCIKAYSSMALCGLMLVSMRGRKAPDRELIDKLRRMFDWMETHKCELLGRIEEIDLLGSAGSFYLLSRAQGINMMRSASLWIEETAKVPANVMSIDNFYHGPMEIIRAQKIAKTTTVPVLLDIRPDDRSRMIWSRINDTAPGSLYFGADSSAPAAFRFMLPEFGLDATWMMLIQALYFQLLSYHVARCRDIEPGMFFNEGWVVT